MTSVVCVGIAVMDLLFAVDRLPDGPGKLYASGFIEVGGGVAANAAVAIARLGGTARFVGRLGDDALGTQILSDLGGAGVDVAGVTRVPGVASPLSAVLVDAQGERLIINHTRPELFIGGDLDPARDIGGAAAVLVDVRWPHGAAVTLDAAAAAGIPAVLDFDRPMQEGGDVLAQKASHVAFSEAALAATSGTPDPAAGLARISDTTDAWLAVTAGEEGVYWLEGGEVRHLPAFDVAVVDTLGAGDVFHGALALALGEGQVEAVAVRFASAAAAIKCTRPGGRAGAPTRDEVVDLLERSA